MIRAIIFDYYGVIAQDAFWYRVKGLEAAHYKSAYIQELSNEVNLNKIPWRQFCEAVSKDLSIPVDKVMERYANHKIKPGIIELIGTMAQKYRVVLLSNASAEQLLPVMKHLGLDKLFERVFVSSEVGLIKPDPEIFLHVSRELGLDPEECVMIDDAKRNIDSAVSVGMRGIVFEDSQSCSNQLQALTNSDKIA